VRAGSFTLGPVAEASTRELCKAPYPGSNPGRVSNFLFTSQTFAYRDPAFTTYICCVENETERMAILEREFYRSARGPAPDDVDVWRLMFDAEGAQLVVRHEWQTDRHSGIDDFTVAEFLLLDGAARDALLGVLFGPAESSRNAEIAGELAR